jgi:hypothetical protein
MPSCSFFLVRSAPNDRGEEPDTASPAPLCDAKLGPKRYRERAGDGRQFPQIPAKAMLWTILLGQSLRESSFHALESLVSSGRGRSLGKSREFAMMPWVISPSDGIRRPRARAAIQVLH